MRDFGFGVQAGLAVGDADVDGTVGQFACRGLDVETHGIWVGGQLRVYQMLWKQAVDEAVTRPSAITAFVNVRSLYYHLSLSVLTSLVDTDGNVQATAAVIGYTV